MRVRSFISVAFLTLFFAVPALRAADVRWPAKFGDWAVGPAPADPRAFSERTSQELGRALINEAGLVSVVPRAYAQGDKKAYFTLYTFRDSSGAYEAYTFLRILLVKIPDERFIKTIYKSNQVLDIASDSQLDRSVTEDAARWVQSISDGVSSPPIAGYLPNQDREAGSDFYALGPEAFREAAHWDYQEASVLVGSAGFNSGAEAIFAKYKSGKDGATLLLIEYPTPQLAELHLRHLQRGLADAKLKTSSVERKGSLLSIVLAPTSAEYAEKLRGAVNYETQVTWNEPSSTATDPPITSTLVKIITATGVFMMVTLVLGIAFGGVRVITKRLFPGKVFDRPAQMEVLQLGLSSKPIDPRDMY
jgi:hypothetical protein